MVTAHHPVQNSLKKIIDFQKFKSRELKRPVSYYEALALWFSETVVNKKNEHQHSDRTF